MKNTQIIAPIVASLLLWSCIKSENNKTQVVTTQPATATGVGGVDGGGGKGVLCDSKVMTLDLYEAIQSGVQLNQDFGNLTDNLKFYGLEAAKYQSESLDYLQNPQISSDILNFLETEIINKFQDITYGQRLPLTQDAHTADLPTHCKIIQIAIYAQDGKIYRDPDYWSQLSTLDQAVLVLHEFMYARARKYGAIDSDESRKAMGFIFSKNNSEYLLSPLWNKPKKIWCGAGIEKTDQEVFELYGIEEVQNQVRGVGLYFIGFKNTYVTLQTSTFIPGNSLDDLLNNKLNSQIVVAQNKQMNKMWNLELGLRNSPNNGYTIRAYKSGKPQPPFSNMFCKLL